MRDCPARNSVRVARLFLSRALASRSPPLLMRDSPFMSGLSHVDPLGLRAGIAAQYHSEDPESAQIRGAHLNSVSRLTPYAMAANAGSGALVLWAFRQDPPAGLWWWWACLMVVSGLAIGNWWRSRRRACRSPIARAPSRNRSRPKAGELHCAGATRHPERRGITPAIPSRWMKPASASAPVNNKRSDACWARARGSDQAPENLRQGGCWRVHAALAEQLIHTPLLLWQPCLRRLPSHPRRLVSGSGLLRLGR